MTAPGIPEARIDPREEEQEVVLRLGDILPRVPAHLVKPGTHDRMMQVRFSVDELAEKISRGRASVPVERLVAACPEVFMADDSRTGEPEIQLPLQKLLEQVGLSAPKPPAPNGIPKEQLAQARAEASRIIESAVVSSKPVADSAPVPAPLPEQPPKLKRRFLGIFSRSAEQNTQRPTPEKPAETKPALAEKETKPAEPEKTADIAQTVPPPPVPVAETIPPGFISLRLLPIFRLLPAEVFRGGDLPGDDVRITLPLATIDPQLAAGHVEISLEDFTKALPEGGIRDSINPLPDTQVWIPLDEIFQSLPPDHMFYMPPFEPLSEPAAPATPETPAAEATAPAPEAPASKEEEPPAPATPPEPPKDEAPMEAPPAPEPATPDPIPEKTPEPVAEATPIPDAAEPPPATETPPPAAPPQSRAPWMRGFQVPPPRLFGSATPAVDAPAESASPDAPPAAASTSEARSTTDFLASQPGIFAAAAFVQGAVFASEDFPRKPDLDALRDFMGAIVERAQESGRQLGWSRVLTLACDQFHATAVVRDTHFIVALHHERTLPPVAHDALMAAAEDLSKGETQAPA